MLRTCAKALGNTANAFHVGWFLSLFSEFTDELAAPGYVEVFNIAWVWLRGTLDRVHEFVMNRVHPILQRAFVVAGGFQNHELGAPPFRIGIFLDFVEWCTFFLGQIAEERKHDAVFFLHRVTVYFGACGRLGIRLEGRYQLTFAVTAITPAVIGADDTAIFDRAVGQRAAAVRAGIGQHMGGTCSIAKRYE